MQKLDKDFYSLRETAEILGRNYRTIQNYIYNGTLSSVKIGGRYSVPATELERILTPKRS